MTKELQEQIRLVAEYDGWVLSDGTYRKTGKMSFPDWELPYKTYSTSIDAIRELAVKVKDELESLMDKHPVRNSGNITKHRDVIDAAAATFDPMQIFLSVHAACVLLNQYKSEQK